MVGRDPHARSETRMVLPGACSPRQSYRLQQESSRTFSRLLRKTPRRPGERWQDAWGGPEGEEPVPVPFTVPSFLSSLFSDLVPGANPPAATSHRPPPTNFSCLTSQHTPPTCACASCPGDLSAGLNGVSHTQRGDGIGPGIFLKLVTRRASFPGHWVPALGTGSQMQNG